MGGGTVKKSLCLLFLLFLCILLIAGKQFHDSNHGFNIVPHGTDFSAGVQLVSGETLLQTKNFTSHKWDSKLGPC